MTQMQDDARWMASAIALASRGRGLSTPNPNVGCVLVQGGAVVSRGWTQAGGRPHAEAMALDQAGALARGTNAYVTLEPCAHDSDRGHACADSLIAAGVARVVIAITDPDPRTAGRGIARMRDAGLAVVVGVVADDARKAMAGWLSHIERGRPHITLKLATSLDGCIAMADGTSRWITGDAARAHGHMLRAQSDAILVGRGTWDADAPTLDVRLPGLADRSSRKLVLSAHGNMRLPDDVEQVASPAAAVALAGMNDLLVEGGAGAASAFLAAGLVDRIVHYQAPMLIGGGRASLGDIGLRDLADAHARWQRVDHRTLGNDQLSVYERLV